MQGAVLPSLNDPEPDVPPDPDRPTHLFGAGVLVIVAAAFFLASPRLGILRRLGTAALSLVAGAIVSTIAGFLERSGRASLFAALGLLTLVVVLIFTLPKDPPGSCELGCVAVAYGLVLGSGPAALLGFVLCILAAVVVPPKRRRK